MTQEQMKQLQPGDIVKHAGSMERFMVTANYGVRATAVRTVDITNPDEWELIREGHSGDRQTVQ